MKKRFTKNLDNQRSRSRAHSVMHIPKTGGTSVGTFLVRLSREIGPATIPTKFHHIWTVEKILKKFPEIKLSFVLRDPIDRHISGFQSRLRMGRPVHNHLWSAGEAISFSFFPQPLDFLRALVSSDERLKSAALFAYANIRHQAWNYVHYFRSVEYLKEIEGNIGVVGRIERMDEFLRAMCRLSGADEGLVETLSTRVHESAVPSASIAAELSPGERAAIRDALRAEYEIYDHLLALADRGPAA